MNEFYVGGTYYYVLFENNNAAPYIDTLVYVGTNINHNGRILAQDGEYCFQDYTSFGKYGLITEVADFSNKEDIRIKVVDERACSLIYRYEDLPNLFDR